jgi:hypothetical protein
MSSIAMRAVRRIEREVRIIKATACADAFIASYPKAGRTWLRFILAGYLNDVFQLGLEMNFRNLFRIVPNDGWDAERGLRAYAFHDRSDVPLLVASHRPYRRLIFKRKSVIFMARDPRDLMVSAYYHRTRHVRRYEGEIGAFVRDPRQGLADYVRHLNGWAHNLGRHRCLAVGYERLSAHTEEGVGEALRFIGLEPEPSALARAVAGAAFGSMQALEIETGIPAHSYDRSDANSLRVRRGQVGGYVDDLEPADIDFIDRFLDRRLSAAAKALLASAGCWRPDGAAEATGAPLGAFPRLVAGSAAVPTSR